LEEPVVVDQKGDRGVVGVGTGTFVEVAVEAEENHILHNHNYSVEEVKN
jgi:hypothetical protein